MQGKVIRSTGSWFEVLLEDGIMVSCTLKGGFRTQGLRSTNPIAVGDNVTVLKNEDGTAVIREIADRTNYIIRRSTFLAHKTHIVAANLDQAVLLVTLREPRTSTGFIDRFLVTAEAYGIPVKIVFNKTDLYREKEFEQMAYLSEVYADLGYPCSSISVEMNAGIEKFKNLLDNKISLITGHSGVGKSSLINKILPDLDLRTNEISHTHSKGMHTTTFAEMFEIPNSNGFIVDTPGIKGFGLVDLKKEELSHYFPEMRDLMNQCKFNNCVHINEPSCAVKAAVDKNYIAMTRYESYLNIFHSDEDFKEFT